MNKVKFTENTALQIIQSLFNEVEINFGDNDLTVPSEWRGKSIVDALNVEYYTFKYRPLSTTELITKEISNGATNVNFLQSIYRSFCLLYLGQVKRAFAKDVDTFEAPVNLEFWVQTNKVQLLEMLISECNISLIGQRIPIDFGEEKRRGAIQFGNLSVTDVVTGLPCGEMTAVSCECTIFISPDIADYSDYDIYISIPGEKDEYSEWEKLPINNFHVERLMTSKSVPYMNNPLTTGNINLSNAKTFTIGFYGYKSNKFVSSVAKETLSDNDSNNLKYKIRISRVGETTGNTSEFTVVVSRHTISVEPGTGYETHTATFVVSGMRE